MKKQVKKVGSSLGIIFSSQERRVHDIKYDDILDIEICRIKRQGDDCAD